MKPLVWLGVSNLSFDTSFLRQTWAGLFDLVFPPTCVNCGRVGSLLCPICWADETQPITSASYPPIPYLDGIVALALHSGAIRQALHALKYENVRGVAQPLAQHLAPHIQWTFDAIIPVPLHFSRHAEREYNQANLLAQALATFMSRPVHTDLLMRHRATTTQVGLNAAQRQENVKGAFSVVVGKSVPTAVLLVDDVCTTGSTLGAAAGVLKEAGAKSIYAATISLAS